MFKKVLIAVAVVILVTATAGVAKMADIKPNSDRDSAYEGINDITAGINIAAELENKKAEEIKQQKTQEEAEAIMAKQKESNPRQIFAELFPGEDYDESVNVLTKVLRGEARGVKSNTNKACVIWCVLNRVDRKMRGDTVIECAISDNQFNYHKGANVVTSFRKIAEDVMNRWLLEKSGAEDVGRVLPKSYCYFYGNGRYNVFRIGYKIHGSRKVTPVHSGTYKD
jgi:hypothetical protein